VCSIRRPTGVFIDTSFDYAPIQQEIAELRLMAKIEKGIQVIGA
jgi:hypothetical protein